MLNAKSKFGKNNRKPIFLDNMLDIEVSLKDSILFLRSLEDTAGKVVPNLRSINR